MAATAFPFLRRAYFVDDYYFVTMAKGILQSPWRPYDFKSDDAGIGNVAWERGQRPRMVNPPLFHYYLAAVIAVCGEESWKLRSATLLFSLMALVSMYFLGKRLVPDPFAAALLMAVCPAYWLTSYSLLIDSALVGFLLVSLLTFVMACEKRSVGWICLSGVLMGMTMLVKYFGVIVVLLAFLWQMFDPTRRRWKPAYAAYAVFLAVQLLWAWWNVATYGQSHFLAALPRGMGTPSVAAWAQKGIVVASFIGGTVPFVLVSFGLIGRHSKAWAGGVVAVLLGLYLLLSSRLGGFDREQALLFAIFATGTLAFLVMMGRLADHSKPRKEIFIVSWVLLGILELIAVMPWTAGRYLVCLLPALAWVFVLLMRDMGAKWLMRATCAATALVGLVVAHGDYAQANTIISLSRSLAGKASELQSISPKPEYRWYYLADTFDGSQPYLLPLGWENVLPHQKFKRGDLFLRAYYRKSSWWNVDAELKHFRPVFSLELRSLNPIRVMDVPASAGFYASCWGALPWMFTPHPLERFELYQAE